MFTEEMFRKESEASASQNRKEIRNALQGNRQPHEVRPKLNMINRITKFAAMFTVITSLASIALAQQVRVYAEGGGWVQEITGSLSGARNLHVKVDMGSVRVQGSSQAEITYVIRNRSYDAGEQQSRRERVGTGDHRHTGRRPQPPRESRYGLRSRARQFAVRNYLCDSQFFL